MKKLTILILCMQSTLSFSSTTTTKLYEPKPMVEGNRRVDEIIEWNRKHPGVMPPLTEQEKKRFFTDDGVPVPGSGVQIRSFNSIKMTKEQISSVTSYNKAQKYKGYSEQFSYHAQTLSQIPNAAKVDMLDHPPQNLEPHDTHLRSQASQLKMNYEYHEVDSSLVNQVIGFAPENTYVNNGWNGAVEFFTPKSLNATCAYHEINIKLTGTSAVIPKEIVSYKVNKKITTISAEGNNASGFLYQVEWWDKDFKRNLECTAKEYSTDIKNEVIILAKAIDNGR